VNESRRVVYISPTIYSPVTDAKQALLNINLVTMKVFLNVLPVLLETNQAVMNQAEIPLPGMYSVFEDFMVFGQFRHNYPEFIDDALSFIAYPVFDSFDEDRKLVGVLSTNIHWRHFFKGILQPSAMGIICILENSFNQTLAYRLDGPEATYVGESDLHDPRFDHL
jgi:hypothetical protein